MTDDAIIPEWIEGIGPDADVVISTRARLARNLAAFPFPERASREDLTMVVREVRAACASLSVRFPRLKSVSVDKLEPEERSYLLDAHIASADHLRAGEDRVLILDPSAVLSVLINEEDHIRLQAVMSGLVPEEAWELVDWADDVLAERLNYGFSKRYGYLTADVSNVGTGLRVSVMMHLAGLGMKGTLKRQLRAAYDLGVSVRGLFGEGSRFVGDLFQVSNEVTLGFSEIELVRKVRSVAQYLLCEERSARKELVSEQRKRLIDAASEALRVLQSTMSLKAGEALKFLSSVRLAASEGLAADCPMTLLNKLLVGMRAGDDNGRANIERATFIRHNLAKAHVIPY
jgi:protein arginine kinase